MLSFKHHIVWCPKYQRAVLTCSYDARLRQIVAVTAGEFGWTLHAIKIMPDHAHPFFESDPTTLVAEIINRIKGRSSRLMREKFPTLRSLRPTLWSRSYLAVTVDAVSEATIRRYIDAQKGV